MLPYWQHSFIISPMSYLIKLKELLMDALFPPLCLNCGKNLAGAEKNDGICLDCLSKIVIHRTFFCPICRARLPENKKICHKSSPYLLGAVTNYDDLAKNLIHRLKYDSWSRLKKPISVILRSYLKNLQFGVLSDNFFKNYIVIPIPLHKNRERERGFNQAELIGRIIAEEYGLPLENKILIRAKETKSQAELKNWEQRKENLESAFKIADSADLKNKNVILVDDVYTSGATINEAAKVLKSAGCKKIIAFVIAKKR